MRWLVRFWERRSSKLCGSCFFFVVVVSKDMFVGAVLACCAHLCLVCC